jgi:hypothetical protein
VVPDVATWVHAAPSTFTVIEVGAVPVSLWSITRYGVVPMPVTLPVRVSFRVVATFATSVVVSRSAVPPITVNAFGDPTHPVVDAHVSTETVVPAPAVGTAAMLVRPADRAHGFAVAVT